MLDAVQTTDGARPKALIVPHAGYIYSGPVAASAYRLLRPIARDIRRVLLLGPAHRLAFSGIACSSAKAFRTPLGDVPQEKSWLDRIKTLSFVQNLDQAFTQEHCLEVQLPFLQRILSNFSCLPLLVGHANPEQVSQVLEVAINDPQAMIIVTTDLSHYHSHPDAEVLDARTNDHILNLDHASIKQEHACGRHPLSGLLLQASIQGWRPRLLDLRNSGDTSGSKDRVVGYGAYVLV
jgi:AmmeMemoRadiSam system protein B